MKTQEVKQLLQAYFNGESSLEDEKKLEAYFKSGNVAAELAQYAEFFGGVSELASASDDANIEEDVMDYILENEHQEKTKYRSMWKMVTGIAASVIIVLSTFLVYQDQQKPFDDTFEDPDEAYVYATKALSYVGGKYSKGVTQLSNFEKLRKANEPVKRSTEPVVEFYDGIDKLREKEQLQLNDTDSL